MLYNFEFSYIVQLIRLCKCVQNMSYFEFYHYIQDKKKVSKNTKKKKKNKEKEKEEAKGKKKDKEKSLKIAAVWPIIKFFGLLHTNK